MFAPRNEGTEHDRAKPEEHGSRRGPQADNGHSRKGKVVGPSRRDVGSPMQCEGAMEGTDVTCL